MKRILCLIFLAGCCRTTEHISITSNRDTEATSTEFKETINNRKYGYDVMALATYCDTFLRAPALPYFSTLDNTFGDPLPCMERRVVRGGITDVQVDLVDYTCYRNHVCPPGTPKEGDLGVIKKRAQKYRKFKLKHPEITVLLSPALEYDTKEPSKVKGMMDAAQSGCPECVIIQSPYSGYRLPNFKLELHGNTAKAYSVSNDGSSIFDGNSSVYRINGTEYVAAWFNELNDRFTGEKTFTPPLQRRCRPTSALFRQARMVLKEPEPVAEFPKQCQIKREIKAPETLKTNAESFCSTDKRGNRPMYISKVSGRSGDKISIITRTGKPIGSFGYYGPFTTKGLYRWYIGAYGSGQTPDQLYDQAGGDWAFITRKNGGRTECTRFSTIRRLGTWRK